MFEYAERDGCGRGNAIFRPQPSRAPPKKVKVEWNRLNLDDVDQHDKHLSGHLSVPL
jgi:hypothetical protein